MTNEYPEHEKLRALDGANDTVGEFIEWLGHNGYIIARYPEQGLCQDTLFPSHASTEDLLAAFFGIDQRRLEAEKDAMLEEMREATP